MNSVFFSWGQFHERKVESKIQASGNLAKLWDGISLCFLSWAKISLINHVSSKWLMMVWVWLIKIIAEENIRLDFVWYIWVPCPTIQLPCQTIIINWSLAPRLILDFFSLVRWRDARNLPLMYNGYERNTSHTQMGIFTPPCLRWDNGMMNWWAELH